MQQTRRPLTLPLAIAAAGLAAAVGFTLAYPPVEGLGNKIRLPIFHGALTWSNLMLFALLLVTAVLFLVRPGSKTYRVLEGMRWVSIGAWTVGSVLGTIAAMNTWSSSDGSVLGLMTADPRLLAQFLVMLAGWGVVAASFVLENRRNLALIDIGFVALLSALLGKAIFGAGPTLHPDSPVLNSEELIIKLLFFAIAASHTLLLAALVWAVARWRAGVGDKTAE